MATIKQKIVNCLWYDTQAEEAAKHYTSIFPNSKITETQYYTKAGHETHHKKEGSVMTVTFELEGQEFMALNGGPEFKFNESVSLMIQCETQQEIDFYWERLTEGGEESVCGWLKDKFGLSWQVAPVILQEMLSSPDTARKERVTEAFMKMKKFDIEALKRAFEGN